MLAGKDVFIGKAYNNLKIISMDKEKQIEYTTRLKAILDHNQLMDEAEKRGLEAGEKIGLQKGEKIGLQKGEKIGLQKEQYNIARKSIKQGLSSDLISTITGLPAEEIEKLRTEV